MPAFVPAGSFLFSQNGDAAVVFGAVPGTILTSPVNPTLGSGVLSAYSVNDMAMLPDGTLFVARSDTDSYILDSTLTVTTTVAALTGRIVNAVTAVNGFFYVDVKSTISPDIKDLYELNPDGTINRSWLTLAGTGVAPYRALIGGNVWQGFQYGIRAISSDSTAAYFWGIYTDFSYFKLDFATDTVTLFLAPADIGMAFLAGGGICLADGSILMGADPGIIKVSSLATLTQTYTGLPFDRIQPAISISSAYFWTTGFELVTLSTWGVERVKISDGSVDQVTEYVEGFEPDSAPPDWNGSAPISVQPWLITEVDLGSASTTVTSLSLDCNTHNLTVIGTNFTSASVIELAGPNGTSVPFTVRALSATRIILSLGSGDIVPGQYCVTVT